MPRCVNRTNRQGLQVRLHVAASNHTSNHGTMMVRMPVFRRFGQVQCRNCVFCCCILGKEARLRFCTNLTARRVGPILQHKVKINAKFCDGINDILEVFRFYKFLSLPSLIFLSLFFFTDKIIAADNKNTP